MTESEEESSEEESSDEAFESDNEEKEEEKKDSLPKTRPPPIPKEKLAKVSSKKQLELQKIPSSKSLEETTKETVVETTSRSRGRAVEAVYGVTDGPCPGLYRTKKEAREKNPDSVIKSFGSYQDARESITTSLLEDKEDKEEGETSTSKVKMSPRTRKRVDQKHAEYNAFLALRSTLFNKKKDDSDVRTKNIAFAVSRCLEMSSRPRSSTSSSTSTEEIVNVRGNDSTQDHHKTHTTHKQVPGINMDFSEIVFRKFDTPIGKVVVEEHMPSMFSSLRDNFGDAKTFVHAMTSLGGGKMGEGKSKMLFFKSGDSAFVAKTVKKAELEYFRKICESYYYHMISHPNTLMSRFYGLYRITVPTEGKRWSGTIIIMNNCLRCHLFGGAELKPTAVYDLKGSTKNRLTDEHAFAQGAVGKDLNFENDRLWIGNDRIRQLLEILDVDVHWLRANNIMDYSLLLGVFLGRPDPTWRGSVSSAFNRNRDSAMRKCHADEAPDESAFRYGIQCTADRNIAYTMGVIDILQEYDWKKMAETAIKAKHGKDYATSKVSAIPPKEYGIRFLRYVLGKCA